MFPIVLGLHNILRWVVVGLLLYTTFRAFAALRASRPYEGSDSRFALFTMISMDVQLLLGLLLYFVLSPTVKVALADMGAAMKDGNLRFYGVEHILMNLIAVALVHVGKIKAKSGDDSKRHRSVVIYFGITILLVAVSIPWPFRAAIGRGLFPSF